VLTVTVSLRQITEANIHDVLGVRTTPEQEQFVTNVADSIAEATDHPQGNPWYRAVYVDEQPVGFVMLSWNVRPQPPHINGPWFLWKLLIDSRHQRRGYGQEVVRQIVELVSAHGATELLTSYVPGDGDPSGFYARLGFVPTGDVDPDGEIVLRLSLHD
jgi:GNAT superfamily N-acetyltransferase